MSIQAISLTAILIISLTVQFLLAAGFVRRLKRSRQPLVSDDAAPSVVVILCLRGGDPFLEKCIDGLVTQDYPSFRVCFMIDSDQDPAAAILRSTLNRYSFDNYDIKTLNNPLTTCSLKCSSLIQAIEGLDTSVQFVAFLDADTVPHRTWLRELAAALVPEHIGAATVELVASKIALNQFGIPPYPKITLIEGHWVSGKSLRQIGPKVALDF